MISYVKGREDLDYEAMRQQRLDAGYTEAEVDEEIAAQFFGTAMAERGWREEQAAKDPGLWQKIIDHVKAFLAEIRDAIEKWAGNDLAVQAAMKTEIEDLDRFCDMFQATLDSITENRQQNAETEGTGETKHSMAGLNSKTANKSLLQKALRMEEEGEGKETIRMETGWIKGADKYWRYEIDDSKMEIDDDVLRNDLFGSMGETTLGELLKHDDLFKAYPQLKDMPVYSMGDAGRTLGAYSPTGKHISVNRPHFEKSFDKKADEFKNTLIHEIQHAIQDIEGFAMGASERYWENAINKGYDNRTNSQKERQKELAAEYQRYLDEDEAFVWDMHDLLDIKPDMPRGKIDFDTLEQIEEDPPEWKAFDRMRDELAEKYGSEKVAHFIFLYDEMMNPRGQKRSAWDLYYNTAGEIEARDTESRRTLNAEERKNTRPDMYRTDVVFADNGENTHYSMAGIGSETADRSKLRAAKEMEEDGADSEEIRQATGWFKGYDGKWRYEIDDSTATLKENPAFEIHETDEGEIYRTAYLKDILENAEILSAYPSLGDYLIIIQDTLPGVMGETFHRHKHIVLNQTLFERYTKEYNDYLNGGRKQEIARIEQTPEYREYSKYFDDEYTEKLDPETWLREEKAAQDKFFGSELGKRYYQLQWGKVDMRKYEPGWSKEAKSVLFHELQHAVQQIEGFASGATTRNPNYERVAGEVEARDTGARTELTAEQRKETRPDIDRTDVVFADNKQSRVLDEYNEPVTREDIDDLRKAITTQKSVHQFTQKEIEATAKWAYKYYQQMGVKSPFFRAWFGDWRAYDISPVQVANKKGAARGSVLNADTNWNIGISRQVFNETTSHKGPSVKYSGPYLDYLEDIIHKARLLDTETIRPGKEKSENSLFMHSLYAISNIGNGPELLKLYVEEMYDPNAKDSNFRSYQLQNIEKQQSGVTGSQIPANRIRQTAAVNTVADLYELVKQKDKSFVPGREVSPIILNEDGTPKVFYHGSDENFTVFDRRRIGKNFYQSGDSVHGGFFFSSDRAFAERNYGKEIYPVYLRIENPHIIKASDFFYNSADYWDFHSENLRYELFSSYDEDWDDWNKSDCDAVIINHKKDDLVVIRDANQIKSAETGTTRENIGTFSKYDDDIRYSRVLNNSALDYADRLRQTSRQYWEMLDILEDMAGGSQYHNPLDDLLDESNLPEAERQRLSDQTLQRIARKYIYQKLGKKTGKATPEQVRELAEKLKKADAVLAGAKENIDVVVYGLYKIFKKDMQDAGHYEETELWVRQFRDEFRDEDGKKVKVYIPAKVRTDVTEDYGGPNGFRKAMFGMMDITYDEHAGGTDLKEFYSNLRGETEDGPGANVYDLPDTDNPSDMINNIVRWYNTDPYSYTPETDGSKIFGMTLEEAATRKAIEAAMDMIYFCEFKEFKKSA